jgi:Protein of unknown function (DUF2505)
MKVSADVLYGSASPDRAFALMVNADFRREVCAATHALRCEVAIEERDDGSATVTVRRTQQADVPGFVKGFVGETIDVVQTERWSRPNAAGERTADLLIQIQGQPAQLTGTTTTTAAADGTRAMIRGDVKVSIPFLGKRVEPMIAEAILAASAKEQQIVDKWLGESP